MPYLPRYLFPWSNEKGELCQIYLDAKTGTSAAGYYSGTGYISQLGPSSFSIGPVTAVIDPMYTGNTISFGGGTYTITTASFSPDAQTYTITVVEDLTGASFGFQDYTVQSPVVTPGAMDTVDKQVSCVKSCSGDSGEINDPIITSELSWSAYIPIGSPINFDTFLFSNHDDWQVRMYVDGIPVFHGFLVPDEGARPFQDYPITINFKAVDGLKLLSGVTVQRKPNDGGGEFNYKHSLEEIITACLYQVGTELGTKIYSNMFTNTMQDRNAIASADMFQQTFLDYRSLMTSATEFKDCYTVLRDLLTDGFQLSYREGFWEIRQLSMLQYAPGGQYYTTYDFNGNIIASGTDPDDYGKVGKLNITRAINETQIQSGKFAVKSVRHSFNFNVWEELPRNNKFERVTYDPTAPNDLTPNAGNLYTTTKYFIVDDWIYGRENSPVGLPLPSANTGSKAWRKSVYNFYGVEISREIQMQSGADAPFAKMFRSDAIPVTSSDRIKLSFEIRLADTKNTPGNYLSCRVYIIPYDGSQTRFLDDPPTVLVKDDSNGQKKYTDVLGATAPWKTNFTAISALYSQSIDSKEYLYVELISDPIPVEGDLYIHFRADPNAGSDVYIRNFNLEYEPYVAGGYVPVTGDYWLRKQNKNFPDIYSQEINISDSKVAAVKGAMLQRQTSSFYPRTQPDWKRMGLTEQRHFKELVNIGIYNLKDRRFWKIEGDWDGTVYVNNNNGMTHPIAHGIRYGFEDLPAIRYFALLPNLSIDYHKGRFTGTFQEIIMNDQDGTQLGDDSDYKYLFGDK